MFRKDALPIIPPADAHSLASASGTGASGRGWWRSLEELADAPEFQEYLHREFPENATEWLGGSRRDFLQLMGASLFLAGVSGCDIKQPQEKIVPTVRATDRAEPGLPLYFTTAMDFAGSALGLTVQSREGRPIKIEGNASHPASLGATSVFAQAATLDLYDPDRSRTPTFRGKVVSPKRLREEIVALRARLDESEGRGLRLLIGTSTSPTLGRLLDNAMKRWPEAKWAVFEPVNDDAARAGMALAYGEDAITAAPIYDFSKASVVLSVDCDFLGARDLPPCYVRQFADARRVVGRDSEAGEAAEMVRLYHLGSSPTPTSAKADHPLALRPSEVAGALAVVAAKLGVALAEENAPANKDEAAETRRSAWIASVVDDLKAAGERALVVVGRDQSPATHALAHAINEHLSAVGKTVHFVDSPQVRPEKSPSDVAMLKSLTEEMAAGDVQTLLVLGGNPAFDAPEDITFGEAMSKCEFSLSLSIADNETSAASQWHVPQSHFLESWGDGLAYNGMASIIQPLISPLYESYSDVGFLTALLDVELNGAASAYAAVRSTWKDKLGTEDSDPAWQQAVANGVIEKTAAKNVSLSLRDAKELVGDSKLSDSTTSGPSRESTAFEIVFKPDPTVWDGRFVNNGWLQELPKPLTHVVWDNAAWIAPADAETLHLVNGDIVTIGQEKKTVSLPVWIVPGHAVGTLTLFTGYGRDVVGRVGEGTGFNVQPLRSSKDNSQYAVLPVRKTKRKHEVVSTQHFQVMEGRHLARAGGLAEYLKETENPGFAHPPSPTPESTFYEDWPYKHDNKWGMTIDLTACVGCSACVIACQAENNIPVVGKKQVGMNRHMHWIRVDTYYQGSPEQPEHTLSQPVPCMQCERAPCEVVCPVAATNHSDDGLNQMVYNRCVGTRYCSNNCPYKVRRFNFLDFSDNFITEPSLHLLSNPEVSMRSRGVMEKCSYCIQRIESARIGAQLEDRDIRDGEIKTACQAACPAQAIQFGDLHDEKSAVRAAADHPLNYGLLEELNTKPRTTYLAEVYNTTAKLAQSSTPRHEESA